MAHVCIPLAYLEYSFGYSRWPILSLRAKRDLYLLCLKQNDLQILFTITSGYVSFVFPFPHIPSPLPITQGCLQIRLSPQRWSRDMAWLLEPLHWSSMWKTCKDPILVCLSPWWWREWSCTSGTCERGIVAWREVLLLEEENALLVCCLKGEGGEV